MVVDPRRACARVTVVVLCVCLSVCVSVTALAIEGPWHLLFNVRQCMV